MASGDDTVLAVLTETPLGRGLSPDDLAQVAAIAELTQVWPPAVLFQEGARHEFLYLVVQGLIGLEMCLPRRGCTRILTVGAGEFVGWSALLGEGRMTTRATVVEPATLVTLSGPRLKTLCESDHDIGYAVMQQVAIGLSYRLLATRLQMLDVFGETQPVTGPDFGRSQRAGSATGA